MWDHLASNFNLYVQPEEVCSVEVTKTKPSLADGSGRNDSHHLESESDKGKSKKEPKIRHNKEWKGLIRDAADPPPLRSSELDDIHVLEKTRKPHREGRRTRRSPSPQPALEKKRTRTDEQQNTKVLILFFSRLYPFVVPFFLSYCSLLDYSIVNTGMIGVRCRERETVTTYHPLEFKVFIFFHKIKTDVSFLSSFA